MEFVLTKEDLRYLGSTLAHLDAVTAIPETNSIVAGDYMNTRMLACSLGKPVKNGAMENVGLYAPAITKVARHATGDTHFSITDEGLVAKFGTTSYRLNLVPPTQHAELPEVTDAGTISVRATDLHNSLCDVAATGAPAVVIAITKDGAEMRGEGAESIDCWIPIPGAEPAGAGYSRLSLDILLQCMPSMDRTIKIALAPKGPTAIQFSDSMTYYQAPRV